MTNENGDASQQGCHEVKNNACEMADTSRDSIM